MRKHICFVLIFILLVLITTFPLFTRMNTSIPGFFSTDESYAALWDSWRIKYSFSHNLSFKNTSFIAYPFGRDLYASGYFSYLWIGLIYFLGLLFNPVVAYNIQVFSNFFLSAVFAYILVFYLTGNMLCAFLSGIIFAFCPYQFVRAWQHLGLSYNQWIPLVLLGVILLKERNDRKSKIIFFITTLLALSFDWSIMYFSVLTLGLFFIYIIFSKEPVSKKIVYLKNILLIFTVTVVILSFQFFPIIKNILTIPLTTSASAHNPYHRPFEDLFAQSARPLSYFLPASTHPLFGKFTENFIGTALYGESFTEHALYLGWMPLILAFVAFRRWKKRRKEIKKLGTVPFRDSPYRENLYIGFFIFLAIVAWLFSQPPWWKFGAIKIFMPPFFMYKILPMFRAYCRFGIVVMLAVAVLAGFGLKFILERFKSHKTKIALTCLFSGMVLFEFWNWPPYKVIDVSMVPNVYYWLKEQPGDFAIAEYPLDADSPNEMYKFYQISHEKKIINGTIPGIYANKVAQTIVKLSKPETASILKWMGVKYVLVRKEDYLKTELIEDREELDRILKNKSLKLIKTFPSQSCPSQEIMCVQKTGSIDVYEILALPIEPKVKD